MQNKNNRAFKGVFYVKKTKKIGKKRLLAIAGITCIVWGVFFGTILGIKNYYHKKNTVYDIFTEVKPAVKDECFAIGVIKHNGDGFDEYVVKNTETDEVIAVPANLVSLRIGQEDGEMRGGITITKDGFGNITSAVLYVPEDAVMREYSGA